MLEKKKWEIALYASAGLGICCALVFMVVIIAKSFSNWNTCDAVGFGLKFYEWASIIWIGLVPFHSLILMVYHAVFRKRASTRHVIIWPFVHILSFVLFLASFELCFD